MGSWAPLVVEAEEGVEEPWWFPPPPPSPYYLYGRYTEWDGEGTAIGGFKMCRVYKSWEDVRKAYWPQDAFADRYTYDSQRSRQMERYQDNLIAAKYAYRRWEEDPDSRGAASWRAWELLDSILTDEQRKSLRTECKVRENGWTFTAHVETWRDSSISSQDRFGNGRCVALDQDYAYNRSGEYWVGWDHMVALVLMARCAPEKLHETAY